MERYIDADALLAQLIRKRPEVGKARYTEGFNDAILRVRSMISASATANVVEVVRCKACYYSEKMPSVLGECLYCNYWEGNVDDDFYCSKGERKKKQ